MSKRIHLIAIAALAVLVGSLAIQHAKANSPNMWVEPTRIPAGDSVTIHVRASWSDTKITSMRVTSPSGETWWLLNSTTATAVLSITLPDVNDEISTTFPGSIYAILNDANGNVKPVGDQIEWQGGANTLENGKYAIYAYGIEAVGEWDVSGYFSVPEFAFPSMFLTVAGFALVNMKRRIWKR